MKTFHFLVGLSFLLAVTAEGGPESRAQRASQFLELAWGPNIIIVALGRSMSWKGDGSRPIAEKFESELRFSNPRLTLEAAQEFIGSKPLNDISARKWNELLFDVTIAVFWVIGEAEDKGLPGFSSKNCSGELAKRMIKLRASAATPATLINDEKVWAELKKNTPPGLAQLLDLALSFKNEMGMDIGYFSLVLGRLSDMQPFL